MGEIVGDGDGDGRGGNGVGGGIGVVGAVAVTTQHSPFTLLLLSPTLTTTTPQLIDVVDKSTIIFTHFS